MRMIQFEEEEENADSFMYERLSHYHKSFAHFLFSIRNELTNLPSKQANNNQASKQQASKQPPRKQVSK